MTAPAPTITDYAAVLGHPISHSLSPLLHNAAITACGLSGWRYGRHDVEAAGLADLIARARADGRVRGFSCTMPLKEELVALAATHGWDVDDTARRTGVANTWVAGETPRILNTDVAGIVGAIAETGLTPARVEIVGTGATARSAVLAAAALGAAEIRIHGRNPAKADTVAELARSLGVGTGTADIAALQPGDASLLISTVPVGVLGPDTWDWPAGLPAHACVLDVAYAPGGFDLGEAFTRRGGQAVDGTRMLLHQAVDQFREFVAASGRPRPEPATVLGAMATALATARS